MKFVFLLGLLLFINTSLAKDPDGRVWVAPKNDLYIGPEVRSINSIEEKDFNLVLDKIEAMYQKDFQLLGANLVVERNWDDGLVNAYAEQKGNNWIIAMFGGLARHNAVTLDAFALVACHEIGHHLGGAPRYEQDWASNEGQSDYYGASKCLKRVFEKDNNVAIIQNLSVPQFVSSACEKEFFFHQDIAICKRNSMAGMSLALLFKDLDGFGSPPIDFNTPDQGIVRWTEHSHPEPQCRLDTYFSGALCDKDPYQDFSADLATDKGACTRYEHAVVGRRPNCWFGVDDERI